MKKLTWNEVLRSADNIIQHLIAFANANDTPADIGRYLLHVAKKIEAAEDFCNEFELNYIEGTRKTHPNLGKAFDFYRYGSAVNIQVLDEHGNPDPIDYDAVCSHGEVNGK